MEHGMEHGTERGVEALDLLPAQERGALYPCDDTCGYSWTCSRTKYTSG